MNSLKDCFLETYLSKETSSLLYSEETKSKGVASKLWATIVYRFFKYYLKDGKKH